MRSISITSGKGGVGKTNITISLAHALAQKRQRVLLLDADLGLANIDILLGLQVDRTLYNFVTDGIPLQDILVEVADGLHLLPAHSGMLRLERLGGDERARLAVGLEQLCESYDILLIDTGAGIGDNVLFFNDFADHVLLVTVPEPTALTDTYAMIKILARTYRVESMELVVNQAVTSVVAATVHEKLDQVSRKFLDIGIPLAAYLPNDPSVVNAVQHRTATLVHAPQAPFARGIRTLASHILRGLSRPPRPRRERAVWLESAMGQRGRTEGSTSTTPGADDATTPTTANGHSGAPE